MDKNQKSNRTGVYLMVAGALLLAVAALLLGYNVLYLERQASVSTSQVAQILRDQVLPSQPIEEGTPPREMQSVEVGGVSFIGLLEIPALDLSLPVAKDFSYEVLQKNVCRYAGSYLDDTMIIAGHNYRCHFQKIGTLTAGDSVQFTDVTGRVHSYSVTSVETLDGTAGADLPWDQPGLTLFTCTYSGRARYVVRCSPVPEKTAQNGSL